MSKTLKLLLYGFLPILLIFGVGMLAWSYFNGTLRLDRDTYSLWLAEYTGDDPIWYSQWQPEADNPTLQFRRRLPEFGATAERDRSQRAYSLLLQLSDRNPGEKDAQDHLAIMYWLEHEEQKASFQALSFPLDPIEGEHLILEDLMLSYHQIHNESDCNAYLSRLREIPRACAQWQQRILSLEQDEQLPHPWVMERTYEQLTRYATLPFNEHPLYLSFARRAGGADMTQLNQVTILKFLEEIASVLETDVKPAFAELSQVCLDVMPDSESTWTGTDPAYYNFLTEYYANQPVSPEELHQLGLQSVDSWQQEIQRYQDSIGGWVPAGDPELTIGYESDSLQKVLVEQLFLMRRNYSRYARGVIDTVRFGGVVTRPAYPGRMRTQLTHYVPSALIPDERPARFEVDFDSLASQSPAQMEIMVVRELVPGKNLLWNRQIGYSGHTYWRKTLAHPTTMAGWERYACYLIDHDMAAWKHRPEIRLTYLRQERHYGLRLVVDTGLHGLGWTTDEAMKYLQETGGLSRIEAKEEIISILARPGEAVAAVIGFSSIINLRQEMKEELGADFFLQAFHHALLSEGALPPFMLKDAIRNRLVSSKSE